MAEQERRLAAPPQGNGGEVDLVAEARRYIDRAVIDEDYEALTELRQKAAGYERYWSRREVSRTRANDYGEIKVRAERGMGQIDAGRNPHGGIRVNGQVRSRPNLPVPKDPVTRRSWRQLGEVGDDRFDQLVEESREDQNAGVSTARLIQILRFGSTMNSTTFECYTPERYVEAAREVLGVIDLDPASSPEANETVRAVSIYTKDDDGLGHDWHGRVWLNPPYGRNLTSAFVSKLAEEHSAGRVTAAVTVINAYGFDAAWFQPLFAHVLCFTDHRISFYGGSPTFGSLFAYLGDEQRRFAEVFGQFGAVVRRWP
jgi:hypothetical protein